MPAAVMSSASGRPGLSMAAVKPTGARLPPPTTPMTAHEWAGGVTEAYRSRRQHTSTPSPKGRASSPKAVGSRQSPAGDAYVS
ncbi:hypothetical protein OG349_16930 [Streptomyces sp. NBC_01317]|uniref:hypothetical protein n=1 Tax=Streptomyces sp. NBC_01317 TaxID=2903822 RepID=UPI002E122ECB|nr:hypothetical protein OG349_16930 [Streptomyces sp. NBC_01317]